MKDPDYSNYIHEIYFCVRDGKLTQLKECLAEALAAGVPQKMILEQALLQGIVDVGDQFKNSEVFVPEVLVAARALNHGLDILSPSSDLQERPVLGTVVLGTVRGDIHDIGKRLVHIMMEREGLRVIDLGVNVSAEEFYDAVMEHGAGIVACSALLTTCLGEMKRVVNYFSEKGIRDKVKIMIGGSAASQRFCTAIGADYYHLEAHDSARWAREQFEAKKLGIPKNTD